MSTFAPAGLTPPYVLRTARLVVRCLEPADASQRKEAVDSSGEHLDEMFPRTPEGIPLEVHAAHVRKMRGSFDLDQDRGYGTFELETGRMLGETGLLKRAGLGALEISYWFRRDAVGRGLATEMASAMVKTAFEFDKVKRLDLMCLPENERSAAMARRLGFTFEGRLRDRQLAPHHTRADLLCFTLLDSEYPRTPASQLQLEAYDFLGRRIG
ncbi:GNAT family N-acetyltransferase [Hyalangium versicolor]|uniref:GNAT family N-acetyltransferase n=1 Tax=Hyalangium versicolor TaxID=2861190 RepID=UPI001CCE5824|nr:GNAT family protein [Hyalangium versicolor]